jgi:hypothetical protein
MHDDRRQRYDAESDAKGFACTAAVKMTTSIIASSQLFFTGNVSVAEV